MDAFLDIEVNVRARREATGIDEEVEDEAFTTRLFRRLDKDELFAGVRYLDNLPWCRHAVSLAPTVAYGASVSGGRRADALDDIAAKTAISDHHPDAREGIAAFKEKRPARFS